MPEPQPHARPHLETHTRGKDHSAVAGAAYRLGLRLYDARAKQWHDFRRRALGEEIVFALTVAPPGAPGWATDPSELWNRVEQAEKRKDAQLARDYRIPIPFGLGDDTASALAEEMARFISDQLHTPVSIGLHRDAELDALGAVKPKEKQGFHAHLYFPTRRLADLVDGQEDGGVQGSGFGEKLSMLSNKNTSAIFVESLNERWANLANAYTEAAGLVADYDHRSYERMGVAAEPQLTVGRHVAAMERKGMPTRKGQELREMIARSEIFVAAKHAVAETEQVRRSEESGDPSPRAASSAVVGAYEERDPQREATQREGPQREDSFSKLLSAPNPIRLDSVSTPASRTGAAASSSGATAQAGVMSEARRRELGLGELVLPRLKALTLIIEQALEAYRSILTAIERLFSLLERLKADRLDTAYKLDRARLSRKEARDAQKTWEARHSWQLTFATMPGLAALGKDHQALVARVRERNEQVQQVKRELARHDQPIREAQAEADELLAKQEAILAQLREAVFELREKDEPALNALLSAMAAEDRALIQAMLWEKEDEEASRNELSGARTLDLTPPKKKPLTGRGLVH
ncbi:MobA/MobL family protein [Dyella ginsengisoli]|uniref:MobA/MobL family protein n=1 Tax=Dyella ginsengisoli TaxID=363848 RepID=A0ABW8JRC6_9GAMM